ncbi:hypothetical protein [Sphingomonas faeni]|uniref:hypothetical protein n=1 Tax=Sphingomonas faeni TaxID=185950 RepID=UPI0020BE39EB|nr:hypothetical protein [Sphingomonas faeni]MCK8456786.1 hypothetical protein [Sphingomonas faeni]
MKFLSLFAGGILYWQCVSQITGAKEPWDADGYWHVWYPVAFGLAAISGTALRRRGWTAGVGLSLAQLPVMWWNTGAAASWAIGLAMACLLSIPLAAVSALTALLAARARAA